MVRQAVEMGKVITGKGSVAVQVGNEVVNAAWEGRGLQEGRRLFHGLQCMRQRIRRRVSLFLVDCSLSYCS